MLNYRVEAWSFSCDEELAHEAFEESASFETVELAMKYAWDRMEEGFQTRMYRE